MSAANLRAIAHEGADLVQANPFLGELAAKSVAVVQRGPLQVGGFVGITQVGAEVIRVPQFALGGGEVQAVFVFQRGVAVKILAECLADGDIAIVFGLGLPVLTVDRFGLYADHAGACG